MTVIDLSLVPRVTWIFSLNMFIFILNYVMLALLLGKHTSTRRLSLKLKVLIRNIITGRLFFFWLHKTTWAGWRFSTISGAITVFAESIGKFVGITLLHGFQFVV